MRFSLSFDIDIHYEFKIQSRIESLFIAKTFWKIIWTHEYSEFALDAITRHTLKLQTANDPPEGIRTYTPWTNVSRYKTSKTPWKLAPRPKNLWALTPYAGISVTIIIFIQLPPWIKISRGDLSNFVIIRIKLIF